MSPIAGMALLVAAITFIALIGWAVAMRRGKRIGELEEKLEVAEHALQARDKQNETIAEHRRTGDLVDDSRFLPDADASGSP